jgi:hypothetical protein
VKSDSSVAARSGCVTLPSVASFFCWASLRAKLKGATQTEWACLVERFDPGQCWGRWCPSLFLCVRHSLRLSGPAWGRFSLRRSEAHDKASLIGAAAVLFASMVVDDASAQKGFGRGGGIGMARGLGSGVGMGGMRGLGGGMGIARGIGVGRIGGAGFARPMAYGGRGFVGPRYGALGGRGFVGPRAAAWGGRGFVGARYGAWRGGYVGPRYAGWGRGYWPYRRYGWRRGWGWWGYGWPVAAGLAVAAATTYDDCWRWDGWQWVNVCYGPYSYGWGYGPD